MRAQLEQLQKRNNSSFVCYELNLYSFDFYWHYHPEYELTYIIKGKGKRLVGSNYESFEEGDLVLLGANLPHTWISDKQKKSEQRCVVIQFSKEFFEPLLNYVELKEIKKLSQKAEKGFQFTGYKAKHAALLIQQLVHKNDTEKFLLFIRLLLLLSAAKGKTIVTTPVKQITNKINQQRINDVFRYIENEYHKKISLSKAASLIHLSISAFCKYFKRATGKTFSNYVNEMRIANACELLIETDKPIAEISAACGFESLTYFNRVFLVIKKIQPLRYRNIRKVQSN